MSQNESPNQGGLSGSFEGPIDRAWDVFVKNSGARNLQPDEASNAKYAFFCGAVMSYNHLVIALRSGSAQVLQRTTDEIRQNCDEFFSQYMGHQLPPSLN